jgi:16S rRNA (guanine966-N2)-methyltransferase
MGLLPNRMRPASARRSDLHYHVFSIDVLPGLRIIGGRFRRRQLRTPKGHLTRPTSDRTKESIFNIVEARLDLDGTRVLDLFSGTGGLGIEAMSRGATSATFVEQQAAVMKMAQENAASLGIADACVFVRTDAMAFVRADQGPPYDLILADPPYESDAIPALPEAALRRLAPGGLFVLEHDRRHRFADHPRLVLTRAYGRTTISVFAAEPTSNAS